MVRSRVSANFSFLSKTNKTNKQYTSQTTRTYLFFIHSFNFDVIITIPTSHFNAKASAVQADNKTNFQNKFKDQQHSQGPQPKSSTNSTGMEADTPTHHTEYSTQNKVFLRLIGFKVLVGGVPRCLS